MTITNEPFNSISNSISYTLTTANSDLPWFVLALHIHQSFDRMGGVSSRLYRMCQKVRSEWVVMTRDKESRMYRAKFQSIPLMRELCHVRRWPVVIL